MKTPTIAGYVLDYSCNAHDPEATADEEQCAHPDDRFVTYNEDGFRFGACRACGAIWELTPDNKEDDPCPGIVSSVR
jgi:hypothetical protein